MRPCNCSNKMAAAGVTMEVVTETKDEVILQYVKGDINVKVHYKRLAASKKAELDPAREVKAEK